ncbi:hypothetical protein NQ318_021308 [Aromia moschata]|uniref:oleoyl-[acyl-carrier-protein] hydrolase n=1 Tax=Aromia moschata TaxID=1265417 RepID=A0AAV8ZBW5_9CUCU|nr:hypothetical protein NQ318_021308 [Aromia moschata]
MQATSFQLTECNYHIYFTYKCCVMTTKVYKKHANVVRNVEGQKNVLKEGTHIGAIIIKIDNNLSLKAFKKFFFSFRKKETFLKFFFGNFNGGIAESWTDLTEWLVLRGARKIVVASESRPQQNHLNRRLSLLQSYYDVEIITAPNKAHTKEGAAELLSEVYILGPIHAVFVLPNKASVSKSSDIKSVQYIDNVLRTTAPKALFVNFINSAAGICHARGEAGFCTYNIQWAKEMDIKDAISALDSVLSYKAKNVLVKSDKDSDAKQENSQGLFKNLGLLLPTPADIIKDQKYSPNEPEMIQIVTEGPREIRELAPIFVVPGISGEKQLDELAMNLLYPTFRVLLPSTKWSLKDLAAVYVKKMRAIYPKGPYNIIAISWGGPLAIEIARLLHDLKASIHLFFIDSAPNTLQAILKPVGDDTAEAEISLLTTVLKINDIKVLKGLKDAPNWESRVKLALENYEDNEKQKNLLEAGLEVLKHRVKEVTGFRPNDVLVSGTAHLIRTNDSSKYDSCGLTTYCSQTPDIVLVNGDHTSIVANFDTAEYINKTHFLI